MKMRSNELVGIIHACCSKILRHGSTGAKGHATDRQSDIQTNRRPDGHLPVDSGRRGERERELKNCGP